MYSKILLPVAFDGKLKIDAPLAIAQAVAAKDASIQLLHVFENLPGYAVQYVPQDMMQATREGVVAEMNAAVTDISNASTAITDGSAGRAITDWADEHGIDLIVMPSHRPGMADLLWGSTAAFVVRHAKCAVHVLR